MIAERVRVLCVDDNHDIADSEAMLLDVFGFEARACYDGESALTVAREFCPDACLLDLKMPGMDGDELATRLSSSRKKGTPLMVAITAEGGSDDRKRTRDAGFDAHLLKPVEWNSLLKLLANVVPSQDEPPCYDANILPILRRNGTA